MKMTMRPIVEVANQCTELAFNYSAPTISSIIIDGGSKSSLATVGGEPITISGLNFCAPPGGSGSSRISGDVTHTITLRGPVYGSFNYNGWVRMAVARTGADNPVRDFVLTYWNHSRIEGVSPEGEGRGLQRSVNTASAQFFVQVTAIAVTIYECISVQNV